eukprot:5825890-Karenia_brevis.AAC.1
MVVGLLLSCMGDHLHCGNFNRFEGSAGGSGSCFGRVAHVISFHAAFSASAKDWQWDCEAVLSVAAY